LTIEGSRLEVAEYWDVAYGTAEACSEDECVEELRARLREAVRLRLISDVPLGAFLSGGIDSTAIVALMSELSDRPVQTFAIGFAGEPSFNELEHARRAADRYGTDHHEFVVEPDAVELLPKLVWHHDQPFADSSAIPTYLVSQLTRQHVTVALSGDGGDELFAGYERFAAARLAERWDWVPSGVWGATARLLRVLPESTAYRGVVRRARRFVEAAGLSSLDRYLSWVGLFSAELREKVLASGTPMDVRASFHRYLDQVRGIDSISQLLYLNTKTYLADDLLVKADRMSMAHGLETRSPFLDHELARWAAGLPVDLKLRGMSTKYILKRALRGLVPDDIIDRPKHGFGVPLGRWFRADLAGYVREMLLDRRSLKRGYFRPEGLRWLIEQHQTGRRDLGHQLWTLLTFEMWHRMFIDKEGT
jgi:asparagine synthase (glutamine-hydrolysing)